MTVPTIVTNAAKNWLTVNVADVWASVAAVPLVVD
jgi:hypothetical protein